ncbi:short-chain-enoyl-CoA hydratase [Clostridium saccharobutylicum]|uniref:short-chain-enoyl-CoA hydratase n=1 Tax=Clostridium saccharobutylicum DSM 13864 TaxID=1345695 RepID=U5MZF1_CLOSA|nr:short-chain-enoyl-CoA hydratase [Clostridium saccharobutylicum]AGX45051.1 3-hydroxybutyryl-CoA dehydratase Crt [Clostridium saccharobutylicum DSM 13864]AQR92333.1 putative enoyl-CoA hydratase echA8 [Clostridium saccharobutylicum]AQS02235.1 putative enoyl-CoA hydratase echA8 [Clostridium saccharobutylicum]AQS11839.1 putative enoyl-CoA hydratase echA8 [Clostridium saccharobutylicum]AQS16218.1 putative enoyl-CoA hydratase echA8 [Clostridium saccharobutylicum]
MENVIFKHENGIAEITINRPKSLNALNTQTLKELGQVINEISERKDIYTVIITGAGEKSFVAGADITEMKDKTAIEGREMAKLAQKVFSNIENMPQIVIAAVNGYALGGGCELSMACDIRLASTKAKFGQPEVGLGIIPGFAGTQRLPRLVGKGRAKELIFTTDMIDANEAYRIGLVNKIYEPNELIDKAKEMANKIMSKGTYAVSLAKSSINNGLNMDTESAYAFEADLFGLCFSTEDQTEGMSAFVGKRKASFKGC